MRPDRPFDLLVVSGPTASGKSRLAMALAARHNGIVINADALQVYRELHVLTARPDIADMSMVPHALYGHRPVFEHYAVTDWLRDIKPVIEMAWLNGQLPIVTGGTGFYLYALLHGMSPVPDVTDDIRQEVSVLYDTLGHDVFRARLHAVDPERAHVIKPNDRQRLIRAMEVYEATGRTLSHWQSLPRVAPFLGLKTHSLLLQPPRDTLYTAIDARFLRMVENGALDEARAVDAMQPDPSLPGLKALGLAQLRAYLRGDKTLETAIADAQTLSRQYAKRQLTWLRTQWRDQPDHRITLSSDPTGFDVGSLNV